MQKINVKEQWEELKERLNPTSIKTFRADIDRHNLKHLKNFLWTGCVISVLMLIFQYFAGAMPDYGHAIEMTLFFLISIAIWKVSINDIEKYPTQSLYTWVIICFVFMIFLHTAFNPELPDYVTPMLILIIPVLIEDAPYRIYLLMFGLTAFDVFMTFRYKDASLILPDLYYVAFAVFVSTGVIYRSVHRRISSTRENYNAKTKAAHDALTGVYNRGGGDQLIRDAIKEGACGSFLLMDIDDFKHVNDRYGHGKGDEVLQKVANILKNSFRYGEAGDIVMRMGGDEFIVYARNMLDVRSVEKKLSGIEEEVHKIVLNADENDFVSLSIGCVVNLGSYPSYEAMYAAADSLLYKKKKNGKNGYQITDMDYKPTV